MSAHELACQLKERPLDVAQALLGEPSIVSRSEARWGRKGSLCVTLSGERAGLWFSHEDGKGGDMLDLAKHALGCDTHGAVLWARQHLGATASPTALSSSATPPNPRPLDANEVALSVWRRATSIKGTLADTYLASRNLSVPDHVDHRVLRFAEAAAFEDGGKLVRHPCLVALMRDALTGEPTGIQRTPLTTEAKKHPIGRRMRGRAGIAMISPDYEIASGLHLVEGAEDALAAYEFGYRPVWAAMSAGAIRGFPIVSGIDALTIIADGDDGGVGLRAAQECANRWRDGGREARVKVVVGGDLAEIAGRIRDVA